MFGAGGWRHTWSNSANVSRQRVLKMAGYLPFWMASYRTATRRPETNVSRGGRRITPVLRSGRAVRLVRTMSRHASPWLCIPWCLSSNTDLSLKMSDSVIRAPHTGPHPPTHWDTSGSNKKSPRCRISSLGILTSQLCRSLHSWLTYDRLPSRQRPRGQTQVRIPSRPFFSPQRQ